MRRGEIWWTRFPPPDKTRPTVLVSRDEAYEIRAFLTVAPVTTRVRGIRAEVPLGHLEGLARESVANCDDLQTVAKATLVRRAGALGEAKIAELDAALRFALGLD